MTRTASGTVLHWLGICFAILIFCASPAWAQEPSRVLPPSLNAPQVGEKIGDFTLPDTNGIPVTFSEFLASGKGGQPGWVLLVFYRGYW